MIWSKNCQSHVQKHSTYLYKFPHDARLVAHDPIKVYINRRVSSRRIQIFRRIFVQLPPCRSTRFSIRQPIRPPNQSINIVEARNGAAQAERSSASPGHSSSVQACCRGGPQRRSRRIRSRRRRSLRAALPLPHPVLRRQVARQRGGRAGSTDGSTGGIAGDDHGGEPEPGPSQISVPSPTPEPLLPEHA